MPETSPKMTEAKAQQSKSLSEKDVKAPNLIERAKEEIEAIIHSKKSPHHHKETHGTGNDIDENTSVGEVKAPNLFERAKEEIEALVQTIHSKKETDSHNPHHHKETHGASNDIDKTTPISEVKAPNLFERAKEEVEALVQTIHAKKESGNHNSHHHKETHGVTNDIDKNTPIGKVKAPNIFERAKEEFEVLVQTIHPKKEFDSHNSIPKKEGGFMASIGRKFEKLCSPLDKKRSINA